MRTLLALVPATMLVLAGASPAAAEPAVVRFTDESGSTRIARVADDAWLRPQCGVGVLAPAGDNLLPLEVSSGGKTSTVIAYRTANGVLVPGAAGGLCAGQPELAAALDQAQRAQQARWPWVALVVAFGGLALGVLIIALWGAGRGPEPTLGPARPDAHAGGTAHDEAPG